MHLTMNLPKVTESVLHPHWKARLRTSNPLPVRQATGL